MCVVHIHVFKDKFRKAVFTMRGCVHYSEAVLAIERLS